MPNEYEQQQRLLGFAKEMRKASSDAEHKLWQSLRRKQLDGLKFKRQQPIGPFIADFACDECRLIAEIDGSQHDHAEKYDQDRTAALNELGWRVIRFSSSDAVKHHDAVLRTILRDCGRPSP